MESTYVPGVPGEMNEFMSLTDSNVNVGPGERLISGLAGGALLAYASISRRSLMDIPLAVTGGYLVYRAVSGHCHLNDALGRNSASANAMEMHETVTVNRPVAEVYRFWRRLENLPLFMTHLESVDQLDKQRSHWVAPVPGGLGKIEWDATIVDERENELISWQSDANATINNSGVVTFRQAPGDRGTEVHAIIKYLPPAGALGQGVASLLNPAFGRMVKEDMRRFKRYIETGEVPTNDSPSGRSGNDTLHNLKQELV